MNRMKRLVSLSLLGAFLVALPAAHTLAAPPKKKKRVTICHVTPANAKSRCGRIITVDVHAYGAHLDHGDSRRFSPIKPGGKGCKGSTGNPNCVIGLIKPPPRPK